MCEHDPPIPCRVHRLNPIGYGYSKNMELVPCVQCHASPESIRNAIDTGSLLLLSCVCGRPMSSWHRSEQKEFRAWYIAMERFAHDPYEPRIRECLVCKRKRLRRRAAEANRPVRVCGQCRTRFRPKRSDAKFCSARCRVAASRGVAL